MKRYLSILLTVLLLISVFSVSSFAYTDYVYSPTQFSVTMQNQQAVQGGALTDYSSTIQVGSTTDSGINFTTFKNTEPNYYSSGYVKEALFLKLEELSLTHEYNLNVYTKVSGNLRYSSEYYIVDGQGTVLMVLHYNNFTTSGVHNDNFNFTLESLNLASNSNIYLQFVYQIPSGYSYNFSLLVSDITLRDLDDDTGFFESIIQWIRNVASNVTTIGSNIVNGLSNLGSNIFTWLTSVKDGIVNKLTDVKDGLVNKLTEVKNGIVDKLTAIKDNIVSAINNIQAWFVSLGDRISDFFIMLKNYLLYFKHPVTLNADGVPVDSNGNPVYINPFESALDSVEVTITEWIDSVNDFIDSIDESAETVSEPLQLFKTAFTRFGNGAPFFIGIIVFAVVFFVIRKVVGR